MDSIQELESLIKRGIQKYEDYFSTSTREKIIAYRLAIQGELEKEIMDEDGDTLIKHAVVENDISGFDSDAGMLGIGVEYHVVFKVNYGDTFELFDENDRREYQIEREEGFKHIEWTEDREKWFANVRNLILDLARKMKSFRDADTKILQNFLDTAKSGEFLLEAPKPEVKKKKRGT